MNVQWVFGKLDCLAVHIRKEITCQRQNCQELCLKMFRNINQLSSNTKVGFANVINWKTEGNLEPSWTRTMELFSENT